MNEWKFRRTRNVPWKAKSLLLLLQISIGFAVVTATQGPTVQITTASIATERTFDRQRWMVPALVDTTRKMKVFVDLRGGGGQEEEEEDYDDEGYDEEEEYENEDDGDDEVELERPRLPPGKHRRREYDHRMARPPPNHRQPRGKRRPHWTQRLATQSVKLSSQLAWNTVKGSTNLVYQVIRPKHVDPEELNGLWRLDQQLFAVGNGGKPMASVATIDLNASKRRLTVGEHTVYYRLSKTRLGSTKIEFVAAAFLVGDTPRLYGYKGTWQRKLADSSVLKCKGQIYRVRKPRFGNKAAPYQLVGKPIGTFEARRRLRLQEDEENDDEYDVIEEDYDDDRRG